jgi:hypothetical protein
MEYECHASHMITKDDAWDVDNYQKFASRQITQYIFSPHETSFCDEMLFYFWGNGREKFVWRYYDRPPYELAVYYGFVAPVPVEEEVMIGDVAIRV